jgi:hypothetical protein
MLGRMNLTCVMEFSVICSILSVEMTQINSHDVQFEVDILAINC